MVDMSSLKDEDLEDYVFFEPKPYDVFNDSTLQGCLGHSAKVENMFDKNNLYFCEKCTEAKHGKNSKKHVMTKALKRYLIYEPPKYLIINLKRFSMSGFGMYSKNSKRVNFSMQISLDDFMIHKVHKNNE